MITDDNPSDGHDLLIQLGDEEFWHRCAKCGELFGITRPDQSFDTYARKWERHVMTVAS